MYAIEQFFWGFWWLFLVIAFSQFLQKKKIIYLHLLFLHSLVYTWTIYKAHQLNINYCPQLLVEPKWSNCTRDISVLRPTKKNFYVTTKLIYSIVINDVEPHVNDVFSLLTKFSRFIVDYFIRHKIHLYNYDSKNDM